MNRSASPATARVALIQTACGPDRSANRRRACELVRDAASRGAQIVCLQELFDAQYFPQRVAAAQYALAEPLPSPVTAAMGELAAELEIVLIVPVFEEAQPGMYFNSLVVFDADGRTLGKYRKTHIPDGPQYHEKYYFTPGDLGYRAWRTRYGVIGAAICWDEWFPEVARILALQGAHIVFYPTAIGSEPEHPELSTADAWQTIIRAHGIANGIFVAAANRVGQEDAMSFYGRSFVAGPLGEIVAQAGAGEEALLADVDYAQIRQARNLLQLLRDRRIDTYGPLLHRLNEPPA